MGLRLRGIDRCLRGLKGWEHRVLQMGFRVAGSAACTCGAQAGSSRGDVPGFQHLLLHLHKREAHAPISLESSAAGRCSCHLPHIRAPGRLGPC